MNDDMTHPQTPPSNDPMIQLFCSGSNRCGQLSLSDRSVQVDHFTKANLPSCVSDPSKLQLVRTLGENSVFVYNSRVIYALGYFGATNSIEVTHRPVFNDAIVQDIRQNQTRDMTSKTERTVKQLSCGFYHLIILDSEGDLWGYGDNENGELGLGHTNSVKGLVRIPFPCPLNDVPNSLETTRVIKRLACGLSTYVVTSSEEGDDLWCCGDNRTKQLGLGDQVEGTLEKVSQFTKITSNELRGKEIDDIACGAFHVCLLMSDQNVYCFGRNLFGELGIQMTFGPNICVPAPTRIREEFFVNNDEAKRRKRIVSVHCTSVNTMLRLEDDCFLVCGCNEQKRFGFEQPELEPSRFKVLPMPPQITKVTKISSGSFHFVFLTESNQLVVAGSNHFGQLSFGQKVTPSKATIVDPTDYCFKDIIDICCGNRHTLLLTRELESIQYEDREQLVRDLKKASQYRQLCSATRRYETNQTFGLLFDDPSTSDVKLIIDSSNSTVLHCHKIVLACRCEYFSSMFSHFAEKDWKEVTFMPLGDEGDNILIVTQFIRYLYTGSIEIGPDNAIGLLLIAVNLSMDLDSSFVSKVQEVIIHHLDVNNVLLVYRDVLNHISPPLSTTNETEDESKFLRPVLETLERACMVVCAKNWDTLVSKHKNDMDKFLSYQQYMAITSLKTRYR